MDTAQKGYDAPARRCLESSARTFRYTYPGGMFYDSQKVLVDGGYTEARKPVRLLSDGWRQLASEGRLGLCKWSQKQALRTSGDLD